MRRDVYISINVSPAVLVSPGFTAALGIDAGAGLVIELTEHASVEDYEELGRTIAPLRRRGAQIAVDDAGAGFASLRHILRLSPQIIKLDTVLTRSIDGDSSLHALASALITFAGGTGATIVVEGLETAAEKASLVELGVRFGQGYLLGTPAPRESLPPWVREQREEASVAAL